MIIKLNSHIQNSFKIIKIKKKIRKYVKLVRNEKKNLFHFSAIEETKRKSIYKIFPRKFPFVAFDKKECKKKRIKGVCFLYIFHKRKKNEKSS